MRETVELLASAIHDAKNQLFFAGNAVATMAAAQGMDASAAQNAIELASERLTNALLAYRVSCADMRPSISAVAVSDLMEDLQSIHRAHIAQHGLTFDIECNANGIHPLDRDLIIDILNNAIQNAARHAKSRIALSAQIEEGWLVFRVEDDGAGFAPLPSPSDDCTGLGLHIGCAIARLHVRQGRHGELNTANGGRLGGAVIELRLP